MSNEIKTFLGIQAKITAAFNFFISGMITALIHHKADLVATDTASIAVDLAITCLLTFTITAFFCRAILKSTKTAGILMPSNAFIRLLAKLFRLPLIYGVLLGLLAAAVLFAIIAPCFALLNLKTLPFFPYVFLKALFCMLLGSGAALLELYSGMCKTEL